MPDGSVLNIPLNLFYDIVNIPANEVQGLDTAADSLFFNDNIFVVSAANIFGVDPGDPGHVAAIDSLFAPFPSLTEGLGGLDYQLTGLLASELPISASCAVTTCYPIVPPDVITGITGIDRDIGFGKALFDPDFGLFRNFFAAPITGPDSLLSGYTFDPSADGSIDPAGPVYSGFGFENGNPNFFLGGTVDPVTGAPAYDPATGMFDPNATEVPWAGHDIHLQSFPAVRELLQQFARNTVDRRTVRHRHRVADVQRLLLGVASRCRGVCRDLQPVRAGKPGLPGCLRSIRFGRPAWHHPADRAGHQRADAGR